MYWHEHLNKTGDTNLSQCEQSQLNDNLACLFTEPYKP